MVEKLIPKYDFVKNWSEDQLRDFITTPSGLPHRLMSIVREVIPNINRLRLIQYWTSRVWIFRSGWKSCNS